MFGLPLAARAASVILTPSVSSPQMLGTPVTWTAAVMNAPAGHTYGYQFAVTYNGQTQILSDFSTTPTFTWVPHTVEGVYQFAVVVRDTTTSPYVLFAPVSVNFTLQPWVTTPLATGTVNPTTHPLVALFSGPPCAAGHQLLVRFHPATSSVSMTTNLVPCSTNSANFYVAGMHPSTQYLMHWEEYAGTTLLNTGNDLPFTTGPLPSNFPDKTYTVNVPAQAYDAAYPVSLIETVGGAFPTATANDLLGNVIWYFPSTTVFVVRMEPGGIMYAYPSTSAVALFDLAGNVIAQTNTEILNEQLAAKGYPTMAQFNTHEARNLPDGNIVVMGQRIVTSTSAQGGTPAKPVTIVGDMLVVVDHNLQVVWAWDSFAHEDVNRAATDGDTAAGGTTNDWLHSNAVQGTVDGNLILSQRSQDWVIKINYAKGKGDGSVIWHMGAGGDFTITNPPSGSCIDPTFPGGPTNILPWFTHQHDAHFDFQDDASGDGFMIMTVFDDGNTREMNCPGTQNSRGMVLLVDEATRQIYIETLADLGGYSFALGSAQLLTPADGNIYASFLSGILPGPGGSTLTQLSETNLAGQIVYQLQVNQTTYRTYRMQNLYTPTEFETNPPTGVEGALPSGQPFDYSAGFTQDQDAMAFNGNASLTGNLLQLTDGGAYEAGSVFYGSPVSVQTFTTDFTFKLTNPAADGFTFTMQNAGPNALGSDGGALGYEGIGESVAIKFDLYNDSGEGANSIGLYTNGAAPTVPSVSLPVNGINLHSGDLMDAHITYNGVTLNLTLTDLVTMATFTQPFMINIPGTVGGQTAYLGFTGGTGKATATQQILSWSYEPVMVPYDPTSFVYGTGLTTNGNASLVGSTIELTNPTTDSGRYQDSSAFFSSPVNVQSFNTDFNFLLTNATADGFTFTIQNNSPTALGGPGDGLGYSGISKSVAIKFDLYNNAGEGADSTGIFTNGAIPTVPAIDLTSTGINLHSGDMMHAHLSYDGNALTLTLTDLVTNATWTQPFAVDIPTIVGGNTAYVGFTAGTGELTAVQQILNWTFE
jgi:hypothetical protein